MYSLLGQSKEYAVGGLNPFLLNHYSCALSSLIFIIIFIPSKSDCTLVPQPPVRALSITWA